MGNGLSWKELLAHDPSLALTEGTPGPILGLTRIDDVKAGKLAFAKNSKILSRLVPVKEGDGPLAKAGGLVLEKPFWESLLQRDPDTLQMLRNRFAFLAQTEDVSLSMARLSRPFYELAFNHTNHYVDGRQMGTAEIHPTALIAQGVFIGEGVKVGLNAKIHTGSTIMAYCEIGEESTIFPGVTLYPWVKVGKNCRIHSGTVIGADGFGYHFHQGVHHKIWHMGGVRLDDEVEIGANSCVDGGTFSPTTVGSGTKLDNCVQVGHNCQVGKGVIMCGHVAIGGSSVIGDFTVFGGKAAMGSDMVLGPGCQVAGGGMVNCDWPAGSVVGGHPARPLKEWLKGLAYVRKASLSSTPKE